jgi:S1-C subfamily serine protease
MKPIHSMNRRNVISPSLCALSACALIAAASSAAEVREAARAAFNRAKDSVITVTAVVKMDMRTTGSGRRGSDGQDIETTGTVIGADGLVVLSSTALNPIAATLENLEASGNAEQMSVRPKVDLTQVKYRMADGTEVPARLVYKDKDLDLAFLVPDLKEGEKAPAFTPLDLKASPDAKELDDVVLVTRLAKRLSYASAVSIAQIVAVVTKPRTVYDFAVGGTPTTGGPVFTASGELLGFTMIHRDTGGSQAALRASLLGGGEIIILPAAEVSGLVDFARKAAAKKDDKSSKADDAAPAKKSAE